MNGLNLASAGEAAICASIDALSRSASSSSKKVRWSPESAAQRCVIAPLRFLSASSSSAVSYESDRKLPILARSTLMFSYAGTATASVVASLDSCAALNATHSASLLASSSSIWPS
eukprot:4118784-Prymnesium_polylepis.1